MRVEVPLNCTVSHSRARSACWQQHEHSCRRRGRTRGHVQRGNNVEQRSSRRVSTDVFNTKVGSCSSAAAALKPRATSRQRPAREHASSTYARCCVHACSVGYSGGGPALNPTNKDFGSPYVTKRWRGGPPKRYTRTVSKGSTGGRTCNSRHGTGGRDDDRHSLIFF